MKVKIPDSRILADIDEIRNPVVPLADRLNMISACKKYFRARPVKTVVWPLETSMVGTYGES